MDMGRVPVGRSVRVWGEAEKTKEVFLCAKNTSDGVIIYAVDGQGNAIPSGNILIIESRGITRFTAVNPSLGFDLDSNGRLKDLI